MIRKWEVQVGSHILRDTERESERETERESESAKGEAEQGERNPSCLQGFDPPQLNIKWQCACVPLTQPDQTEC